MRGGPKTRCSGRWTEARFKSFIISLLRAGTMRWAPKYDAVARCFVKKGLNPASGKPCKLHQCPRCKGLFPQSSMHADHIEPVVDVKTGFVDWNTYIRRMFVEVDGFEVMCKSCHAKITASQSLERARARIQKKVT